MNWFYSLKQKIRIAITVAAWVPFVVFLIVVGSITPQGETMPNWAVAVLIPLLALGVLFTVFAVMAYRQEHPKTKVKKEKSKPQAAAPIDETNSSTDPSWKIERDYYTKVRGVTFGNDDGSSRQSAISRCKKGDEVVLLQLTDGEYEGAIGVFTKDGEQLGFLSSERASEIRPYSDYPMKITISNITGGNGEKTFGCNLHIVIYKKDI